MVKKRINCIITDLDNTIWDWFTMWYESFNPYLNRISKELEVDLSLLKEDFKRLHQKYGSTEASYIYDELQSISTDKKAVFNSSTNNKSIIHEYNSLKKNNLSLYDGVLDTLKALKDKGVLIIGFTESLSFFTKYRLKQLQLDGLFDVIYAPIGYELPQSVERYYNEEYWEPEITEFRYLPNQISKPAPEILEVITKDFNIDKTNTIYIGDKLDKDINMANQADITSVYAKYGNSVNLKEYELLREVTHWKSDVVETEKEVESASRITAKYILSEDFCELLKLFEFCEFDHKPNKTLLNSVIPIWEKVIDVQQHFNDLELRIRSFALTAFTFIIGGIGYVEKEKLIIKFDDFSLPYSSILSALGFIIIWGFFYMDKFWYHRLLHGAVKQASMIENKWKKYLPEIALSSRIGNTSPHNFLGIKKIKVHSNHKFRIFYGVLFSIFIILCVFLIWINN